MRISDWSSDVCSSDLSQSETRSAASQPNSPVKLAESNDLEAASDSLIESEHGNHAENSLPRSNLSRLRRLQARTRPSSESDRISISRRERSLRTIPTAMNVMCDQLLVSN